MKDPQIFEIDPPASLPVDDAADLEPAEALGRTPEEKPDVMRWARAL